MIKNRCHGLCVVEGLTHVWAPCSLTDSQIHGLIKSGRFFENPLVGRHVLRFKIKYMASGFFFKNFFSFSVEEKKAPIELGAM